jgi:hypothetical protein
MLSKIIKASKPQAHEQRPYRFPEVLTPAMDRANLGWRYTEPQAMEQAVISASGGIVQGMVSAAELSAREQAA